MLVVGLGGNGKTTFIKCFQIRLRKMVITYLRRTLATILIIQTVKKKRIQQWAIRSQTSWKQDGGSETR